MEKVMFFCVFSYRIIQISSSDVSEHNVTLVRFQLNENISLNCNGSNRQTKAAWYHQNPDTGRLTLLLTVYYKDYTVNYQYKYHVKLNGYGGNNTLVIIGLTESDSGLYFCGTSMDSHYTPMQFHKPIRLVMEDKATDREGTVHSVTEAPENVEITVSTVGVMLTERELIFAGAGLAVLVSFLATVVAGGIIHSYGWRKGWAAAKRAGLTD
ncbi:hypothetical protein QQF64_012976 [Cirrhinus molitorella]|uniref:Ig-like domain-containing protein n=1 Tax=Cirrhinus molitorella TaxID=172907 RepID=A0ABR3LPT0_9TELE